MKAILLATEIVAITIISPALRAAPPKYRIAELAAFGSTSVAEDINDAGVVVGYAEVELFVNHAIRWSNGSFQDLGTFGGSRSFAYGIDEGGSIVGAAELAGDEAIHAFRLTGGVMTDLGVLSGNNSLAQAINGSGQIVGLTTNPSSNNQHAFLWSAGVMTDLGTLGGSYSRAHDINDAGVVVGESSGSRAFRWADGVMQDLGTLGGGSAQALAINNHGQIVGGSGRAFLWQNGVMTNLGALPGDPISIAFDINEVGQIVGISAPQSSGLPHGALWQDGEIFELSTLLDAGGAGWIPYFANAVNNHGWIVGVGINPAGQTRAFLMTPVPEPASVLLAALALPMLWFRNAKGDRRRTRTVP